MDAVFLKLFDMGLDASWLILAVILLRFGLKNAPKWIRGILWAIVAVRLICPFSLESALSLVPRTEPLSAISTADVAITSTVNSSFTASSELSVSQVPAWPFTAGIVWFIGLSAMLVYALISFIRLRRNVREAIPMMENIWLCDAVRSPFILGVVKPRIYMSSSIDPEQIDYVIAHEKAHLRCRDHWWKPLGYLLLSVYWFNPMVWAAYILFCRDIELACDERVIRNLDFDKRKAYSHALLSCSIQRKMIFTCPLSFGEVGIKERVKNVLTYKKPAFWLILIAIIACAVVAVCFLTSPKSEAELGTTATILAELNYDDLMAEYEAFGVTEESSTIYYNGERVRYFLDGYEKDGSIIARFQQYDDLGTVDVHTVRSDTVNADGSTTLFGPIIDIVPYSQEEFDAREYFPDDSDIMAAESLSDTQFQEEYLAERQAQWQEELSPYIPFGVTYSYDSDSDNYKMYYDGKEVRGIYDEGAQLWISEHAGNGTYSENAIDLYAVYDGGALTGVREATAEEHSAWTELREALSYTTEQYDGGQTIAEILEQYSPYGITYEVISGSQGNIYYNGELADCFWDEKPDGSIFATYSTDEGKIRVYTVYDKEGNLTGISAVDAEKE